MPDVKGTDGDLLVGSALGYRTSSHIDEHGMRNVDVIGESTGEGVHRRRTIVTNRVPLPHDAEHSGVDELSAQVSTKPS